jgi:AraC-like DNA-binding protein
MNLHPYSTRDNFFSMALIDDAIAVIESREEGAPFSSGKVAAQFNANRTTLSRRHQSVMRTYAGASQERQKLSP